ncbi:hypothetical protein H9L22_17960 [Tessaracoccus defluvii]|uniref:Uncharacterized protein n=1 Tax=Tessaracoccus defluvii TaxID=1285901 RepID=A0A7H0H5X8_9ACTN|nr:hypothetical protein [Tessaracoccus defluvii]QNP55944.1 hypothetical protein H9L22_17960 [Tessaracoccus defluvii]
MWSASAFDLSGGKVTSVTVTNTGTLRTGVIALTKAVAGSGAPLVPADTGFTVTYTYPAGVGFAGGGGQLVVKADGRLSPAVRFPSVRSSRSPSSRPQRCPAGTGRVPRSTGHPSSSATAR